MKHFIFWIAFIAVVCTACDQRRKSKEPWLTLSPVPSESELPYFLLIEEGSDIQNDTLALKDGMLSLQLLPDSVGVAHLYSSNGNKICSFLAHDSARIHLKMQDGYYRFEGDSVNRLLFDYYRSVEQAYLAKSKALTLAEEQLRHGSRDSIWKLISDQSLYVHDSLFRVKTEQFIAANSTLSTAMIAFLYYNEQSVYSTGSYSWLKSIPKDQLSDPYFNDIVVAAEKFENLSVGATLGFSSFVNFKGDLYSSSSEKKRHLVCFWDPLDSVSVAAHKDFAKRFSNNERSGYAYLGISLNGDKSVVEKCIAKEKIGGVQLLTSGANTKSKREEYGIPSTPFFVLLDTNQVVINAGLFPVQFDRLLSTQPKIEKR